MPDGENMKKNLKANNIEHTAYFYPEVNHGFHNNTTPRYDEKAASLAWERTLIFFKKQTQIKLYHAQKTNIINFFNKCIININ